MEAIRTRTELLLLLLIVACVQGAFVEPLQPNTDLLSFSDTPTRLPCHYQVAQDQSVVQVTWNKELPGGSEDPVIMAHFTEGNREFGRYSGRLKFESFTPITENSALLIPATQESDEGIYRCHITTFPNGNFERRIKLTVWTLPISSLEPVNLVEGQPYGVVASCRAVGHPIPRLSWDTDLPGHSQNRTNEGGAVSSHYSLHPLRSMNGKKLDCLVRHPGLQEPRRISNNLVVQYPPDPIISSPTTHWYVGLKEAELVCESRGYPKPQDVTWTWRGGVLPEGVSVAGEKLFFRRALQVNDSGTYECMVRNAVGSGKTEYALTISEKYPKNQESPALGDNLLLIIIGATAGAVVLLLIIVFLIVRRRHQSKTKKLKMELQETKDEMNSLSRQASFRRLNSSSSVSRMQEPPNYRGSQSTIGGRWGPSEEVMRDEHGRPIVWSDDRESLRAAEINREEEECRKMVETYVRRSNMSLDSGLPLSLVPPKAQQDDSNRHKEPDLGHLQEDNSPPGDDSIGESSTMDGQVDDDEDSSQQLSKTLRKMFYARNGILRPIENPNAILLHNHKYHKPQMI
ncbi:nectin-4-like isoform X2 [Girardinichthys multiradiatus]|uniref:nectin-4-like isoform X2 n=1 Tax=Girardinichthys multiradiatus TaxID=208333 RepID=UPI001FAE1455|nr:nectin-4-like isoform X2 [Girardinichthys multiradiatus]